MAGKGGVGKTTVTAVLARVASDAGLRTLVVETEGRHGLAHLLGSADFDYAPQVLVPGGAGRGEVVGRTIRPDDALVEWLADRGLGRLSRRLTSSGVLDVVATAVPGIRDILVLGKVRQLETAGEFDLVLVDGPAAGHAIQFLRSARGLVDAVQAGPIHSQAVAVQAMLTDATRCAVVLVTVPEETPVIELVETAFALEEEVGVALGPVVVNAVDIPPAGLEAAPEGPDALLLGAAAAFRTTRVRSQRVQLERLAGELPLPRAQLPALFTADLGPAEIDRLADALRSGVAA